MQKLVWIVEDKKTGHTRANWSTGTRVYTRKHNAEAACRKLNGGVYHVVEYALVPMNKEE